jgi:hypothetical protein
MSEHFFTFQGAAATSGQHAVTVAGLEAGDRVLDVLTVSGATPGSQTGSFDPIIPQSGYIIQTGVDLSAHTLLLRIERDD